MPEVTSTFFGLAIGFLLPGFVGLFSLSFWSDSEARAFHTFLTSRANFGLLLFLLMAALVVGLVVAAVRWLIFEVVLRFSMGSKLTDTERAKIGPKLEAFRAVVDEQYRYHQFYGGIAITAPALFVGWLQGLDVGDCAEVGVIAGFIAVELLLIASAIGSYRRYITYAKAVLT
jgi:hypothetical protein